MSDSRRFAANPQAIWEVLDGEVVIANLDGGSYYTLGGSGVALWDGLTAGRPLDDLVTDLGLAVGEPVEVVAKAAGELVTRLVDENLLRERDDDSPADGPAAIEGEWVVPTLEKYTDMQQLLLLDPIHEVDESGWPSPVEPS
jgi:hypothetical protein